MHSIFVEKFSTDKELLYILTQVCDAGLFEISEAFLDIGCRMDENELTRIFNNGVVTGFSRKIEFCLKNGVDVDVCFFGNSPVVNLLNYHTIGPGLRGSDLPPGSAGHALKVMVDYGVDIDNVIWTSVMGTVKKGSLLVYYLRTSKIENQDFSLIEDVLLAGAKVTNEVENEVHRLTPKGTAILVKRFGISHRVLDSSGIDITPQLILSEMKKLYFQGRTLQESSMELIVSLIMRHDKASGKKAEISSLGLPSSMQSNSRRK